MACRSSAKRSYQRKLKFRLSWSLIYYGTLLISLLSCCFYYFLRTFYKVLIVVVIIIVDPDVAMALFAVD